MLDFSGKGKSVNISKTVRDRPILSKFFTHRVLQEYPVPGKKFSDFATSGGHPGFYPKMKN